MTTHLDRRVLIDDPSLRGAALCHQLSDAVDAWLGQLWAEAGGPDVGAALVAVGGYGRGELSPESDIDVWLLHPKRRDVRELAERLWYPIWDEGITLGHAVRTVAESLSLASDDLDTATAVLSVRHLAGDRALSDELRSKGLQQWRKRSSRWLSQMDVRVRERHDTVDEVAFLLEPDLKNGRGGLRDVHAIRWAESAGVALLPGDSEAIDEAYEVILDARVELHRRTKRHSDVLILEEQDGVAAALGLADADDLMRVLSTAARTISWVSDEVWFRARSIVEGPPRRGLGAARDLAPGVVMRDRTIALSAGADPAADPLLVLRVAVEAARHDLRIERSTLERLEASAPMPIPWPAEARGLFVELLLAGHPAVRVVETLDQRGLWEPLVPEWAVIRCRPQRNAYHRFTVDRHLLETAANAAGLTDRVDRSDLLVVGALLHDIGKGRPGDHTEVGMELVDVIAPRMGFDPNDSASIRAMVEFHLLLPDTATRRDLSDDGTLTSVAEAVGTIGRLQLLDALTEADSIATGSAAWGSWKKELVGVLVERVAHVLEGGEVAEVADSGFPTTHQRDLLAQGRRIIETDDDQIVIVCPDRPGIFSRVAGVLSLHGLTVLEASVHSTDDHMALEQFRVRSNFGGSIEWDGVREDLDKALDGRLALEARLAERSRTYRRRRRIPGMVTHSEVLIDNELSHDATVIEVRVPDGVGVLWRITRSLHELDLDITSAKIQTVGNDAVDSFYVRDGSGRKVDDTELLEEIRLALLHALEGSTSR